MAAPLFPNTKIWRAARAYVLLNVDLSIIWKIEKLTKQDILPVLDRILILNELINEFVELNFNEELCRDRLNNCLKIYP